MMGLRKLHRYVSLAVSLQLLLWTISGIYFSFNKIEIRDLIFQNTDFNFYKNIEPTEGRGKIHKIYRYKII